MEIQNESVASHLIEVVVNKPIPQRIQIRQAADQEKEKVRVVFAFEEWHAGTRLFAAMLGAAPGAKISGICSPST